VRGTELEPFANRHADEIGRKLMTATAEYLQQRCEALFDSARVAEPEPAAGVTRAAGGA
jgi:hypothetical protein